jgi:hypothetical protein
VQDLHADLAAFVVNGIRDQAMTGRFAAMGQLAREGLRPAGAVRRDAAADQQSGAAAGARRKIRGELREIARAVFETRVHRSHHDAIGQTRVSEIERREQSRILHAAILAASRRAMRRRIRVAWRDAARRIGRARFSA